MRNPIRLIIADDHALFRQGLRSLLRLHEEFQLVGEVETVGELRGIIAETRLRYPAARFADGAILDG